MKIEDRRRENPTTVGALLPGCVFVWDPDPEDPNEEDEYYIVTDTFGQHGDSACVNLEGGEVRYYDKLYVVTQASAKVVIS